MRGMIGRATQKARPNLETGLTIAPFRSTALTNTQQSRYLTISIGLYRMVDSHVELDDKVRISSTNTRQLATEFVVDLGV